MSEDGQDKNPGPVRLHLSSQAAQHTSMMLQRKAKVRHLAFGKDNLDRKSVE